MTKVKTKEQLLKKYKATYDKVLPRINGKVAKAKLLLEEAVELANKHGVPFKSPLIFQNDTYRPKLSDEVKDLNDEIEELTGVYMYGYGEWEGAWMPSSMQC